MIDYSYCKQITPNVITFNRINSMKQKIYYALPHFLQNILISFYNYLAYRKRYGGKYKLFLQILSDNKKLTKEELLKNQSERYESFLKHAYENSRFYKNIFKNIQGFEKLENIHKLPILNKEVLRNEIENVNTIDKKKAIVSTTGGTTGKPLEVLFTYENMQERYAMNDVFRGKFGYKLGKKTAWFSGKSILSKRDLRKNRFSKTDYLYNVRYYSTFHLKNQNLIHYINDLIEYKPQFIYGLPTSIYEIAKYGNNNNIKFPSGIISAIFTTAETLTEEMKSNIELFFQANTYNQYASSDGAPFIVECEKRNLHLELQSGVFEVLDNNNLPTQLGRLVVTSFTTYGTPLIRYDIGDSIELSDEICSCGDNNPVVKQILGRVDDFVYSPENGKLYSGHISNTTKNTKGIIKFQVRQDKLNDLDIFIEIDEKVFNTDFANNFLKNWKTFVGNKMNINLHYTDKIELEKSGKFRLVKNNIKHLLVE